MMLRLCIFLGALLVTSASFGQFTSVQDGVWNDGATWGNASPGTAGIDFPSTGQDATVSTNVTIPSPFSATISNLTVSAGLILNIASGAALNLNSVLTVEDDGLGGNGFLEIRGTLTANQGSSFTGDSPVTVTIFSGGTYQHNFTTSAGNIINGTWDSGSTSLVSGYTTNCSAPGGLGQSFHHFTWNCPNFVGTVGVCGTSTNLTFMTLNGALTTIGGNLTVSSTGGSTRTLRLFDASSNNTLTVGGDILLNGSSRLVLSSSGTGNTVLVSGNFSVSNTVASAHTFASSGSATVTTSGNFLWNPTAATTISMASLASGSTTLNINGNLTLSPSVASTFNTASNATSIGAINLSGNFSANSNSTLASTATAGTNLTFNGSSAQTFSNTGTIGRINFRVNTGSILDMGTSALTGTGTFTLLGGGTIRVGSVDGLVIGNSSGNIRVTGTRTYTTNGNIIYNGTTQNLGSEWSSTGALNGIAVNLEIANGSIVTNNNIGSTNLVGILSLQNGRLNIGTSNTLTIQGIFISTSNGTIGGSASSNLTFGGSGVMGNLNFATGAESLNNLTIGRSGTIILGTDLTVNGIINLSFGNINFTGRTLTMNGSSISSAGTGLISTSATNSNLVFGGSTFTGAVPFTGAGNTVSNLTFSTPGGAFTWGSPLTIATSLTLSAGTLTHSSGLSMASNSTFFKGGGTISGSSPGTSSSYNVSYIAAGSTGLELPSSATALRNLTINPSSGTVTLVTNGITVTGNLIFDSGTFSAGSNSFTMSGTGSSLSMEGGSFSPGSGTVNFTGTTTIGSPSLIGGSLSFNNVNVSNTLTLPSSSSNVSVEIAGNLVNSGTVNAGSSTTTFNGSTAISGGGATSFNHVLVSNTLTATAGTMNIAGNFTSNGTFNSNNGTVTFNGNSSISGSSQPNFFNVTIAGTVTAPSSTSLGIAGNLNFSSGTFNNNNGTVLFNGTVASQSITGSTLTFNNITVSNPINPGLSINNTSRVNGTLTLNSGAFFDADGAGSGIFIVSSTSQTAGGSIANLPNPANFVGAVTVERYIHGKAGGDQRYLSIPITNGNLSMWTSSIGVTGNFSDRSTSPTFTNIVNSGNTNPSVRTFNSATQLYSTVNGSGGLTSATALNNGIGYVAYDFLNGAVTASYRGTIGKGNIAVAISSTLNNFNLVPNPYPSPIDWDNVTKTNVNNAMYLRADANVFSSYVGGVANNAPFGGWTGEVATGQSFWVTSNSLGATLDFKEGDKTGNQSYFLRTKSPQDYFRIHLASPKGLYDESVMHFVDNATDGFDAEYDAIKLKNGSDPQGIEGATIEVVNLSTYIDGNETEYAINSIGKLQGPKIVRMNIEDVKSGSYTLSFSDLSMMYESYPIVLVDTYLHKEIEITDGIEYEFVVDGNVNSWGRDRFHLRINGAAVVTGDLEEVLEGMKVYPNPVTDKLLIDLSQEQESNLKSISLMNIMGNTIISSDVDKQLLAPGVKTIDMRYLSDGVYLLNIQCGEKVISTKIIKRN